MGDLHVNYEISNFYIEEDPDFTECLRCDSPIITKGYQSVMMVKQGDNVRFEEHIGLKICSQCCKELKSEGRIDVPYSSI